MPSSLQSLLDSLATRLQASPTLASIPILLEDRQDIAHEISTALNLSAGACILITACLLSTPPQRVEHTSAARR